METGDSNNMSLENIRSEKPPEKKPSFKDGLLARFGRKPANPMGTPISPEQTDSLQQTRETQPQPKRDIKETSFGIIRKIKDSSAALIVSGKSWGSERLEKQRTREHRQKIESGEELKDFMAEVRGKLIDKAARSGNSLPISLGIGVAGGLLRRQAFEVGLEVAEAAPAAAAIVSIARNAHRAFTSDGEAIAALSARYVRDKPVSATPEQTAPAKKGFKEKAVPALAKGVWWTQIVERTAVKAITKKELEEGSRSKEVLEFIDKKVAEVTQAGGNAQEYLGNAKQIRSELREWLKEKKVTDKTGHLVETFGFLTDAKTLNNYRDIDGLENLAGGTTDETVQNLETLRESLHDVVLANLYSIKNLNKDKFHDYVDQLTRHKWGRGRKLKYAGAIVLVGASMAAVKAFAGVKAIDLVRDLGEATVESGVLNQASEGLQEFGQKSQETAKEVGQKAQESIIDFGEKVGKGVVTVTDEISQKSVDVASFFNDGKAGDNLSEYGQKLQEAIEDLGEKVRESAKSISDEANQKVDGITGTLESNASEGVTQDLGTQEMLEPAVIKIPPDVSQVQEVKGDAEDIFAATADVDEAPWTIGAEVGRDIYEKTSMGDLEEIVRHGEINVSVPEGYGNFFGHWISEGGPLNEETALKMGEQLKDAFLLDQKDFMAMARLISELIANANSPMELENILNAMDKEDALKAAYYIYAEGLIKNPDSRNVIVDFIRNNTG